MFVKLLKPAFATLRKQGITIVGYIDDSLLIADSEEELLSALKTTRTLFDNLGLTILKPVQKITYLGFELDSVKVTVALTTEERQIISGLAQKLLEKDKVTIREFAF